MMWHWFIDLNTLKLILGVMHVCLTNVFHYGITWQCVPATAKPVLAAAASRNIAVQHCRGARLQCGALPAGMHACILSNDHHGSYVSICMSSINR